MAGGTHMRRAVVYFFWGERHMNEAVSSVRAVTKIVNAPTVAITDEATASLDPISSTFTEVVVAPHGLSSLLAKADLHCRLPAAYDSFLFLDTDVTPVADISYGFEKAEEFGIAASMAPHYSLDYFWGFDRVLSAAGLPCRSQLQYNTGVIFFIRRPDVDAVFRKWAELALDLGPKLDFHNDQPFFSLAMELLHFNPFCLSPAYNYRALGELASGLIRIWHSHAQVPPGVNEFEAAWPPRRFQGDRRVPY